MTPERLLLAAMHNIIDTTGSDNIKKVGDYLETRVETFTHFAWLPKKMCNNKFVWLKNYIEVREYADIFGISFARSNYRVTNWTPEDHILNILKNDSL